MATSASYIAFVLEQLDRFGDVRAKKMFGEYMVYLGGKPILVVCDNIVYVKKLPALAELLAAGGPRQRRTGGRLDGGAAFGGVGNAGPAAVLHNAAGAVQHVIEQAAAVGIQLQIFKLRNANAPLLVGFVGR